MRVVYMGTPAFAIPLLEALLGSGHEVVGIYTQPDRAAGRGRGVTGSPVKAFAEARGLRVLQPASLRQPAPLAELASLAPELVVVAAYGRLLPAEALQLPLWGCLNLHPSLLPRYRGPSPVPYALLNGDETVGASLILLDEGMDSGPIIAQREEPVLPDDTADTLTDRLFRVGATLLAESLPAYLKGEMRACPQDEALATYTSKLTKEEGELRWELPAIDLWRQVRAYSPWPGSYTHWQGGLLKVLAAVPVPAVGGRPPGTVIPLEGDPQASVGVCTGEGVLGLRRVQLEGRRAMDTAEFLSGHREFLGALLSP